MRIEKQHLMRKYILGICMTFIAACNYNKFNELNLADKDTVSAKTISSVISATNNDTLFVQEKAALFVMPDSSRIAKSIKEIGLQNFQTGADDYAYYLNEAGEFLDSVKIKTYDTKDKKVIKFIGADKTYETIECNKLPELWSIYFFDPAKKSKQADMTIIEEEYKKYFTNNLK